MDWTAVADPGVPAWLSVNPGSGTGNGTLTVAVDSTGLVPGNYTKINYRDLSRGIEYPSSGRRCAECRTTTRLSRDCFKSGGFNLQHDGGGKSGE